MILHIFSLKGDDVQKPTSKMQYQVVGSMLYHIHPYLGI